MKKVNYVAALCAAIMVLGCESCKKEKANVPVGEKMTIGAGIGQANVPGGKTDVQGDGSVFWSEGDRFSLFSRTVGETFLLETGAGENTATFSGNNPGCVPYYAFYPEGAEFDGAGTFVYSIPAVFSYESTVSNGGPMSGYSSDGQTIQFHNAMSLLKIGFKGNAVVKKVTLEDKSSTPAKLNGTLNVSMSSSGITVCSMGTDGNSMLTLTSNEGVALNSDTYTFFTFPVPTGSLKADVEIKVYGEDETNAIKTLTKNISAEGVAENTVYTARVSEMIKVDYEPEYVDFGQYGKWATCNVGADHPWECGDYYQWAATTTLYSGWNPSQENVKDEDISAYLGTASYGNNSYCPYWYSNSSFGSLWTRYLAGTANTPTHSMGDKRTFLISSDDIVDVTYDGNWRMPGISEWNALLVACDISSLCEYDDNHDILGCWITLKTDNTKKIFLPAGGALGNRKRSNSQSAEYWSRNLYFSGGMYGSTPGTYYVDYGYALDIHYQNGGYYQTYTYLSRGVGLLVRPFCPKSK